MLYLACTTISSVDLAQYGVSLAKDWVSVKCGTSNNSATFILVYFLNGVSSERIEFAPLGANSFL